jgi:hypothetical protein
LVLAARLPYGEQQRNRLRQQATRDKAEHPCRRIIEPLEIVDDAEQRPLFGEGRHQAKRRQRDKEPVRGIAGLQTQRNADGDPNGVHMYLAQVGIGGGFGPWRDAIDKVEALEPQHIVAGHQNKELDDNAERTIAETRQYLDDAEELLRTENSAVDFFNAKIERYPNHLGRFVLWAGASVLYGVREHPDQDVAQVVLSSWLGIM